MLCPGVAFLGRRLRHRLLQQPRVGVQRPVEHGLDGPRFHEKAAQHDGDAVADVIGRGQVVRDVEDADLLLVAQLLEHVHDRHAQARIDHRDRLIGQDQARLGDEGPRHRDPLDLAARQLVRVTLAHLIERESHLCSALSTTGAAAARSGAMPKLTACRTGTPRRGAVG